MNLLSFGVMALVFWGQISAEEAATDNLLVNPSFNERGTLGRPVGWKAFVMPMDGATGHVDAPDGADPAAMLYNPAPYPEDPANNWSQSVVGDFDDAELVLRGRIKTEDATEAALWIQCWDDAPAQVIAGATSAHFEPVFGTQDWTPVDVRMVAPAGTDFVMVRCVLRGVGRAWFDDLVLTAGTDLDLAPTPAVAPEEAPAADVPDYATNAALREAVAELQSSNRDLIDRLESLRAGAPDATAGMDGEAWRDVLEAVRETDQSLSSQIARLQEDSPEYRRLAQENAALRDALIAMESANATLQEQLREVRQRMAAGETAERGDPAEREVARAEVDIEFPPSPTSADAGAVGGRGPDAATGVPRTMDPGTEPDEQTLLDKPVTREVPPLEADVEAPAGADITEDAEEGSVSADDNGERDEVAVAREAAIQLQARLRRLREGSTEGPTPTQVPRPADQQAREGERAAAQPERPTLPEPPTRPVVEGREAPPAEEPTRPEGEGVRKSGLPTVSIDISGGPELLAPEDDVIPGRELRAGDETRAETAVRETDGEVRASLAELERMNARLLAQVTALAEQLDERDRSVTDPVADADAAARAGERAELAKTRESLETAVASLQTTNQRLEERLVELERTRVAPSTDAGEADEVEREMLAKMQETNTALDALLSAFRTANEALTRQVEQLPAAIGEALRREGQGPAEGTRETLEAPPAPGQRPPAGDTAAAVPAESDREILAKLQETNTALEELADTFRVTNENLVNQLGRLQADTRELRAATERAAALPAVPRTQPEEQADTDTGEAAGGPSISTSDVGTPPLTPRPSGAPGSVESAALLAAQMAAAQKSEELERALGELQASNELLLERLERLSEAAPVSVPEATPAPPPDELLAANTRLQMSIEDLQALNQGLLDRIGNLQAELQALRSDVMALAPDTPAAVSPQPEALVPEPEVTPHAREYGHILVPHNPLREKP